MKLLTIGAVILMLSACSSSWYKKADHTKIENGFTPGYASLFDGKTIEQWTPVLKRGDGEMHAKVFTVNNGQIHVFGGLPDGYQLNEGKNDTHGMIFTKKKYSMYSFKFQYKWGTKRTNNFDKYQYDAGAFYHVVQEKIWPKGLEYQVRYNHVINHNHTGDLWNLSKNTVTVFEGEPRTYRPLSKGGVKKSHPDGEFLGQPASYHALDGQWNQVEVIVMADKFAVHKLNGQVTNVIMDLPFSEGKIGLQSETAEIFYRNIEIKEFDSLQPLSQFAIH